MLGQSSAITYLVRMRPPPQAYRPPLHPDLQRHPVIAADGCCFMLAESPNNLGPECLLAPYIWPHAHLAHSYNRTIVDVKRKVQQRLTITPGELAELLEGIDGASQDAIYEALKRPKPDSERSQLPKRGREGAKSAGVRKHRDKSRAMQKRRRLLVATTASSLEERSTQVNSGTSQTESTAADTVMANGHDTSNTDECESFVSALQGLKHRWEVQSLCSEMELNLVLDEQKSGTSRTGGSVYRESI
ncbi:hypothetical protein HD553DRAFT_346555 [Filobasidium floriforme]|uniref:uncharacterized protein n=1 Tax=Filobasidium floriforme TaxID=5210 RepID=UPI001E8CF0F5|nr:uncharacterized protein HD553DRAFT_346555 [Filobasidium floriforme]KAH8077695.1 hypothetical protein HD553DRAFT_346555 [Filobasidium floriforme]